MRTMTYNDEDAPWSGSNHLMESDGSPQVKTVMTTSPEPLKNKD
jgi:hypothetical protein